VRLRRPSSAPALAAGRPPRRPVAPLRPRRGHVHDRVGGVLHPGRRTERCSGRSRSHRRRSGGFPGRGADGQARRPLRSQADVGGQLDRPGRDVRGVALHHRLHRIRRHGCRHGGRRRPRRRGPRCLHDRRPAARRAGAVTRLHVLRAQRRLHARLAAGRDRIGLRLQRRPPRAALVHRRGVPRQRRCGHPAAAGVVRRAHAGGTGGEGPGPRAAEELGLAPRHVLRRRLLDQPGAAQHRDPAVAGRGDRCPASPARVPLRHQHRHVHLPADGRRPRGGGRADRAEGGPGVVDLLRGVVPHHAGYPRHRRVGDHRAGVAGSRHRDGGRALPLGRQLVVRGRADGPAPAGRVPGRCRAQQHAGQGVGARCLHLPRDELGRGRVAGDRRDHRARDDRHPPLDPAGAALPGGARPGRRAGRRPRVRARRAGGRRGRSALLRRDGEAGARVHGWPQPM
ncbi:MAG: Putative membrane transport protein, partial [uncultured Nocardioides sp.]